MRKDVALTVAVIKMRNQKDVPFMVEVNNRAISIYKKDCFATAYEANKAANIVYMTLNSMFQFPIILKQYGEEKVISETRER